MSAELQVQVRSVQEPCSPWEGRAPGQVVLLCGLALLAIGLVAVATASATIDGPLIAANPLRSTFGRQIVFVAVGVAIMFVVASIGSPLLPTRLARVYLPVILLVVALAAIVAVLLPGIGDVRRGSQRWISLGPAAWGLGFQPSEVAKLALVVALAAFLGQCRNSRSLIRAFLPALMLIGVTMALVGFQDLGTAALLGMVGGLSLFAAGCRISHLVTLMLAGAAGCALLIYQAPYRLERINGFLHMWEDPRGSGYHAIQSLTTIASGGWTGAGLGAGVQKYGYLPESRTDFIFAVLCEETGMIGGLLVIALYAAVVILGLGIARRAVTGFERLLAFGIVATLGLQAAMNIAVVTVSMPTTGISLPLISVGGTGVVTFCTMLGLLVAVAARGSATSSADAMAALSDIEQTT